MRIATRDYVQSGIALLGIAGIIAAIDYLQALDKRIERGEDVPESQVERAFKGIEKHLGES